MLFDNGDEIDLTQVGLISGARPKPKPLRTPAANVSPIKGRSRNSISRTNAASSIAANKTPLVGKRTKYPDVEAQSQIKEDQLQRMVNLQKEHGDVSRLRMRHASAHADSALQRKIRKDMENIFDREDSVTS